jgi:gas vesicle protein
MKLSNAASVLLGVGASINTSFAFVLPHSTITSTSSTVTATTATSSRTATGVLSDIISSHRRGYKKIGFAKELFSSAAPSDVEIADDNVEHYDELPAGATPIVQARNDLIQTATDLTSSSPTGLFITLPSDRALFVKAIARLEAISPTTSDLSESLMLGEWELVATSRKAPLEAAASSMNKKKKKASAIFSMPKLNPKIKNSIKVTQMIRSNQDTYETGILDRVDNIIEFDNTSTHLLPAFLNPLSIDQSKLILIHKAKVESFVPFRTKLALQSIVLNIAGTSQNLDPDGADVFGLNIPSLSEWMNSGEFDTTYVDDDVRVSRGTIGFLDETRVFIRKGVDLADLHVALEESVVDSGDDHDHDADTPEEDKVKVLAKAVGGVIDAVGDLTDDVKTAVEKDLEYLKDDAELSLQEIRDVVEDDMKDVGDAVLKVKSAIIGDEEVEEAVDDAVDAVRDLGTDVEDSISETADNLKDTVEENVEKIQDAVDVVSDAVLKEEEEEVEEEVAPSTETVDADGDEEVEEAVDDAVGAVMDLGTDVEETISKTADNLKETVEEDVENIQDAVEDVSDAVLEEDIEDVAPDANAEKKESKNKGKGNKKKKN